MPWRGLVHAIQESQKAIKTRRSLAAKTGAPGKGKSRSREVAAALPLVVTVNKKLLVEPLAKATLGVAQVVPKGRPEQEKESVPE